MWIAAHPDLLGDRLLSPEDPVRFLPSRFSPAGEAIDPGGERTRRLACPRCHLEIPQLLLEKKMTITSIVGSPSSGKSYFIASAMWKLREDLARLFSVAFTDTDPAMNRSVTENEARLFLSEDRSASVHIDKTELEGSQYDSVQFDPGVSTLLARPHIFTLRPARDHVNGHAPEQATHLLTLYDNAGEHFFPGADSARAPGTQHLAQAEALMFVFDPTQDVRFRQRLGSVSRDPQLAAGAKVTRQDQLIVEMARRVRVHGGLAPHERVPKPLFVVLSKSDIWGPLLVDESGAQVDITSAPYWHPPHRRHERARARAAGRARPGGRRGRGGRVRARHLRAGERDRHVAGARPRVRPAEGARREHRAPLGHGALPLHARPLVEAADRPRPA
jgi:hypothetical protein